jgi:hypothetical protein
MSADTLATVDDEIDAIVADDHVEDDSPVDEVAQDVDNAEVAEPDVAGTVEDAPEVKAEDAQPLIDKLSPEEIQERIAAYDELVKIREQHDKLKSGTGRLAQQWGEERKQLTQQLQEFKSMQERAKQEAEAAKLVPYDRKHPEYDKWQSLLQSARNDERTLSMLQDPDQQQARQALQAVIAQKYTPDEQKLLSGYDAYVQRQSTELFSNPKDYIRQAFEEFAPQFFQKYTQVQNEWQTVQHSADQFLSENKEVVDKHGSELLETMNLMADPSKSAEIALELVRLRHGNQSLTATAAKASEKAATARAQSKALGSKAGIPSAGPRSVPVDPAEGLDPSMKDFDFIDTIARRSR